MKRYLVVLAALCLSLPAVAKDAEALKVDSARKALGIKNIDELTKTCKKFNGLFPIYQDTLTGATFLHITKDKINMEYIYFCYALDGAADAGLTRGLFL